MNIKLTPLLDTPFFSFQPSDQHDCVTEVYIIYNMMYLISRGIFSYSHRPSEPENLVASGLYAEYSVRTLDPSKTGPRLGGGGIYDTTKYNFEDFGVL